MSATSTPELGAVAHMAGQTPVCSRCVRPNPTQPNPTHTHHPHNQPTPPTPPPHHTTPHHTPHHTTPHHTTQTQHNTTPHHTHHTGAILFKGDQFNLVAQLSLVLAGGLVVDGCTRRCRRRHRECPPPETATPPLALASRADGGRYGPCRVHAP